MFRASFTFSTTYTFRIESPLRGMIVAVSGVIQYPETLGSNGFDIRNFL